MFPSIFLAIFFDDFSLFLAQLYENGALQPVPIKRKLAPIFDLLLDESIQNLTLSDGSKINITMIHEWVLPYMAAYCELSGINCYR